MSIISKLQIYYRREYITKGGLHVHEDEEHLVSQLCSVYPKGDPQKLHYYQEYESNKPNFGHNGFTNIYQTYRPSLILAFQPGAIYLDNWHYTYNDFYSEADLQLAKKWVAGDDNDYPLFWKELNKLRVVNRSSGRMYLLPESLQVFWINNEGDKIVPVFYIIGNTVDTISSSGITIVKSSNMIFEPYLLLISKDIDISTIYTKFLYTSNSFSTEVRGIYNGEDVILDSSKGCSFMGYLCEYSNISTTGDEWLTNEKNKKRYQEWENEFKKVKFHILFSTNATETQHETIDDIGYNKTNTTPTTSRWNGFTFLNDVSNLSLSPIDGFGFYSGSIFLNFLDRYDDELGQESNDPNHTDDPNDRDPGHGPGGSSGDNGGDGDHDNTSDKILPPGIPTLSGSGVGLFTIFNPTASQLAELGKKLWNSTTLQAIKQYFSTPMETILGLGIIPVQPRQGSAKNILLGVYDTEISCTTVSSDYVIKDCGSISINRYYGSYLDYDPYTRISLYLPYIGEIQIDPDEVMQSVLGVQYYVNVVTGDCVAIVTSDGSIVYTAAGNCIRQLPIGQADYSNIINTAVSAVSTIATAVAGGTAASSVGNAVAGAAKTEAGKNVAEARASSQLVQEGVGAGTSLINQVMQSKMRYNHAGSIGVGSGQLSYQNPYLTIERPNLDLADNYKSFVGYPCNETMQLSHCSGFTQIESCKLSVSGATDGELTEILAFLTEGVII